MGKRIEKTPDRSYDLVLRGLSAATITELEREAQLQGRAASVQAVHIMSDWAAKWAKKRAGLDK